MRGAEPGPRGPALTLLAYLGVADTAAIASDVLGDPTSLELARRAAARILGELGEAARASLPALLRALDDPAPSLRQDVIAALARLGPAADGVAPELVERLRDPDVGLDVALLLVRMGRGLDDVAPVLVEALTSDPDEERRVSAARVLGSLPDATTEASVPALSRAVMSGRPQVFPDSRHAFGVDLPRVQLVARLAGRICSRRRFARGGIMTVEGRCEICRTPSQAVSTPIPGDRHRVVLCSLSCESTYRRLHAVRQAIRNDTRRGSRQLRASSAAE